MLDMAYDAMRNSIYEAHKNLINMHSSFGAYLCHPQGCLPVLQIKAVSWTLLGSFLYGMDYSHHFTLI